MSLPKPRAVLFDWDNTLVDTWPVIHAALNNTLAHMGHEPWPIERVKRDVKRSMRDAFPELFGDRWEIAAKRYQQDYIALHMEALEALPGAEDMLNALTKTGVYIALVSNKRGPTLRKEIEALGWQDYFKAAIGADDASSDKPDPAPAMMALEGTGIAPGPDIWFIGDTGVDLECAGRLGATPVLFGAQDTDGKTHDGFAYSAHVNDHEALKRLFKEYF